ncbi:hypothetical protein WMF11_25000 [Sorangium sp. So ce295]|uniref:hypothetical protein n=1 Tax=Sorangium sp. So ce295 TaxID=3133295 RepID=UPI003F5E4830
MAMEDDLQQHAEPDRDETVHRLFRQVHEARLAGRGSDDRCRPGGGDNGRACVDSDL